MKKLTMRTQTGFAILNYSSRFVYVGIRGGLTASEKTQIQAAIERLAEIEDILGEDYDLDRLRELVEADRDGRCYIPSVKIGDMIFVHGKEGGIISTRIQGISLPVHGNKLILHLGGYPAEYLWSDREGIDWWRSREAAKTALKGEAYGG